MLLGRRDGPFEELAADRRAAHAAVIRASLAPLELGLHQRADMTAWGRPERGNDRAEVSGEQDERYVDRDEVDRLGEGLGRESAGIRPLHRHDARVAAQRPGELSAAHVESVDPARAALQQDVRET